MFSSGSIPSAVIDDDVWQHVQATSDSFFCVVFQENRYHIITLSGHTSGVFEGFTVTGSTLYFWIAKGGARRASVLEFGFEGVVAPASLSSAAQVLVESLFQEMVRGQPIDLHS